jgi:hypothetical protein
MSERAKSGPAYADFRVQACVAVIERFWGECSAEMRAETRVYLQALIDDDTADKQAAVPG